VWLLGLAYFGVVYGGYSLTFFLPTMIEGFQHRFGSAFTPASKTLLTQIPYVIAGCVLVTIGYLVDKSGKLGKYALLITCVAAVASVGANYSTNPYLLVVLLSGALCASSSGAALIFSLIPKLFDGRGAAASLAIVSSVGISAGFFGPFIMGWLKDLTSGYSAAMWIIAGILIISGTIIFMIDSSIVKRGQPVDAETADKPLGATRTA
jgi:MFS family permease